MVFSRSSKSAADPLWDVITALGAGSARRTRLEASGHWSLSFPSVNRIKFVAVLRGRCCMVLPRGEVHDLAQGDVCLIGRTPYVAASDPKTPSMEGLPLFTNPDRDVVRLGGDESVLIGGSVSLSEAGMAFALDALPPFLHISSSSPSATVMARTLGLLEVQTEMAAMGGTLVAVKLAEILLVEALRAYSADKGRTFVGWISALGDRQIGHALRLMHGEIAFAWTVSTLAKRVGMSRSAFSDRFTGLVGRPPMDHLRGLRMALAQQMLQEGAADVGLVAAHVGYSSQSAFGQAFRRTFGRSPMSTREGLSHSHGPQTGP
ncbi:UNVERIFIED_ORG: AraC-like DNA-binding protein [Variovorax guangxiensis]